MAETGIFGAPFFTNILLPFILIFTLVFAILEKTKILGQETRQINSLLAFVMAMILVGVSYARNVINTIIPVIAVYAVILLLFMLIYAFVSPQQQGGGFTGLGKGLQIAIAIITVILLVGSIVWSLGLIPKVTALSGASWFSGLWQTLVFAVVIIIIVAIALRSTASGAGRQGST